MPSIFEDPWANESETREEPTTTELQLGFQCGPANPDLFNFLFHCFSSQILSQVESQALVLDCDNPLALKQSIDLAIAAALAGIGAEDPLKIYNPVYPEVTTNDGFLSVGHASGNVTVNNGGEFNHRGSVKHMTSSYDLATLRTFPTVANKVYHLRWQYNAGSPIFVLKDLASAGYNPTALVDGNTAFDTTYDDMLIAKIVTNASNVGTVTALKNKNVLATQLNIQGVNGQNLNQNTARFDFVSAYNWARRPADFSLTPALVVNQTGNAADNDFRISPKTAIPPTVTAFDVDRYRISQTVMSDYSADLIMSFSGRA